MFTSVFVTFDWRYVTSMFFVCNFYIFFSHGVHVMYANSNFMDRCIEFLCKYFIGLSDNKALN